MSAINGHSWAWRPDRRVRAALRKGECRYEQWRRELAEQAAAARHLCQ